MLPSWSARRCVSSSASRCSASAALTAAESSPVFFSSSWRSSGRPWGSACRATSARNGVRRSGARTTCAARRRTGRSRRARRPLHGRAGRREHGRGPHGAGEGQSPLKVTVARFRPTTRYPLHSLMPYLPECELRVERGWKRSTRGPVGRVKENCHFPLRGADAALHLDPIPLPWAGLGGPLSTVMHRPEKLSTGCESDLWMPEEIIPKATCVTKNSLSNRSQAHFRVEMLHSKELITANAWTKGDLPGCGRIWGLWADLSTNHHLPVDLSPGREDALWITSVDEENPLVGPGVQARSRIRRWTTRIRQWITAG